MAMSQSINGYINSYKPNESIDQYKAQLVAKGLNQPHGFDYFETCSPIVDPHPIHGPARLVLKKNKKVKGKVSAFLGFGKSVPDDKWFCLESPLTFYFYFIKEKIK